MDTSRIELFLATVDHGSLTRAAREVHLSQPAASRALRAFEEELGCALFERRGRSLVLTPSGRAALPWARRMLAEFDGLRRSAAQAADAGFHDVRVGTVDSIATYVIPSALPALRDLHEGLGVKLVSCRTADLLARLEEDIDIAIVAWSGPPPFEDATRLGRYEMQFYGRLDLFPSLADVTAEEELAAFPLVQIEPQAGQPTLLDPDADSWAATQSLSSVKALIMGGFGVGALLSYMVSPDDEERLARAKIPHDPDCALWAVCGPAWKSGEQRGVLQTLVDETSRLLRRQ